MSHIKGGGRAVMTEETENELIDLLLDLRVGNDTPQSSRKKHDQQRERRRFVKALVKEFERTKLSQRFNPGTVADNKTGAADNSGPITLIAQKPEAFSGSVASADLDGKVRIELVEAVYGGKKSSSSTSKKNSSSTSKKNSSSKSPPFQAGNKKLMVLPRSTSIKDIFKQAKTKLRMKKAPNRCFVADKDSRLEIDLLVDLRGVTDNTTLYVSHVEPEKPNEAARDKSPQEQEKSDEEKPIENEVAVSDPLDAVKESYRHLAFRQSRSERKKSSFKKQSIPLSKYPCISEYFDKLPKLSQQRAQLPAASCRESILQALDKNRVLIVCGATGSGKSTNVPQFLWEGMQASNCADSAQILVTQPRRVAATSLAQHVASEMNSSPPGEPYSTVGYHVRMDRSIAPTAKIVYCTIGILVRMLVCPQEDVRSDDSERANGALGQAAPPLPALSHYSHIVLDEVHERDLNTDFCLTLLRNLLKRNPTLRIILMSATASADLFVNYFTEAGFPPPVIDIPGRTFPVDIKWLRDCERAAGRACATRIGKSHAHTKLTTRETDKVSLPSQSAIVSPRALAKIDWVFVTKLIESILHHPTNHYDEEVFKTLRGSSWGILIFLPGKAEIAQLDRAISDDKVLSEQLDIIQLHSTIPKNAQRRVFIPAAEGKVKLVLATNIAETSLTIPDITHVIDTGYVKESPFNTSTRIKELVTVWTSQASAKQRSGRAGRTRPGMCWRVYAEEFFREEMLEQTPPEIVRTPLDELVLQVGLLFEQRCDEQSSKAISMAGTSPAKFLERTPEPPPAARLEEACSHLLEVGGLSVVAEDGASPTLYRLTPLGYHLSRLPMDAKVGKVLIVGCILECLDPALTVAAVLSHTKSMFLRRISANKIRTNDWDKLIKAREMMIQQGFGGKNWPGGSIKGDLIAAIAVYQRWTCEDNKKRKAFCKAHALDDAALREIDSLRRQFLDRLKDAGFVSPMSPCTSSNQDAILTSCCLVAGLYPHVATLLRPRKGKLAQWGGRLLTKDGDECKPSSSSFQVKRVMETAESGKDAYAVYHAKHRSLNTANSPNVVFLQEVNFVSKFALMLFGGNLEVEKNAVFVDKWLKFKVTSSEASDHGSCILIQELRKELDRVMLSHISSSYAEDSFDNKNGDIQSARVLALVKQLVAE